jgi:hypothetical protein
MFEVEIKSVSRLSDQVEAKIARANRAFQLSSRILAAAREDLNSHGEWLERHRLNWAAEVKRHRRLLHRKLTMRTAVRSAVGFLFAAPFGLARALEPNKNGAAARVPSEPRRDKPTNGSSHVSQHRTIRGLDGPLCTMEPAPLRAAARKTESRTGPLPFDNTAISAARTAEERQARRPFSALGLIALCLMAAGAVYATLSGPTGEAPALAAKKTQAVPPLSNTVTKTSLTVPKTPKPVKRPAAVSGSLILARPSEYQPVQNPPKTVVNMALISRPLTLASSEPEPVPAPTPAPIAKPVTAKPAAKIQVKQKLAERQPQPAPWWQQWSWMRLR